jgi:colanic acid/amylovoran biosynthesis glycosyltransferase
MDDYPAANRSFPHDGQWHFVQACRLIEKKGLDVSLRAFAGFCRRFPQSTFTIAGEGPLLAPLQQLCAELGVTDRVRFAGFLGSPQLCRLYHESHAFLHPSQTTADQNQEGVPNSMLEAMATGLAVVATLHGGIPEAITDNVSGLLTEERDGDRRNRSAGWKPSTTKPARSARPRPATPADDRPRHRRTHPRTHRPGPLPQ